MTGFVSLVYNDEGVRDGVKQFIQAQGQVNVLMFVALILGCDKTSQPFEKRFFIYYQLLGKQITQFFKVYQDV